MPTLLAWPHSVLVLDIKGELADGDERHAFPGAAGFCETLGLVLRFAPTHRDSHAFNPLLDVRRGANEVRDVQNIGLTEPEHRFRRKLNGQSDEAEQAPRAQRVRAVVP